MILIIITFHVVETFLRINVFPVCLFSPPLCLKNSRPESGTRIAHKSLSPPLSRGELESSVRLKPSKEDNGVSRGAKRCTVHRDAACGTRMIP